MVIAKTKLVMLMLAILLIQGCADELTPRTSGEPKEEVTPITKLSLSGLDSAKPPTMNAGVQVAYNNDTIFFHITWQGDKGDTDEFLRYTAGRWQLEGGHRREAQSTINVDSTRGRTDVKSTNAETSVSFVLNDPQSTLAIPGFKQFGCFVACHDDNMYMPKWDTQVQQTMYLRDDVGGSAPRLDLWIHRMALGSSVGWADDQSIGKQDNSTLGGRKGETGDSAFESNVGTNNLPNYLLDGALLNGVYVFDVVDREQSQNRFFMKPTTKNSEGAVPPVASSVSYFDAEGSGYKPEEGDAIPAFRLREPTGNRGDISAIDTHYDQTNNTVHASMQRKFNTFDASNPVIVEGRTYDIAFAIHTDDTAGRDHYISFPMTLSVDSLGNAQIKAVKYSDISGTSTMPDFSNETQFPIVNINLALPGITSYEFVISENVSEIYTKPDGSTITNVMHSGSSELMSGSRGCSDCHTINIFSDIAKRRGGVVTPTPISTN